MEAKVVIIILNLNSYSDTSGCLKSLQEINYSNYSIILVDNGSTDGSPEKIAKEFPSLKMIRNSINLGFAEGCNIGIKEALKSDFDYILLLNNDTVVDQEFLGGLVNASVKLQSFGASTPKIYYLSPPDSIWYVGTIYNPKAKSYDHLGMGEKDVGQYDELKEFDRLTGCAMLISKKAIEQVGLFDPSYFFYGEEEDWCYKARQMGFKLYYIPRSKIWHKVSAVTGSEYSPGSAYYMTRNHLYFLKKYGLLDIKIYLWILARIIKHSIKYNLGINKEYSRAVVCGILDFFLGKRGKSRIDWSKASSN